MHGLVNPDQKVVNQVGFRLFQENLVLVNQVKNQHLSVFLLQKEHQCLMQKENQHKEEREKQIQTKGLKVVLQKPTYVRTDSKRKMKKEDMHSDWKNEELFLYEVKDKKGKGSGKKDACYHKVKSRYSVWPSAYASGALVKCRKKGAKNWGNSTKKEAVEYIDEISKKNFR